MRNTRFRPRKSPVAPSPDPVDLRVELRGIAEGGAAVGKVIGGDSPMAGMTAFVPFAAPGETVTARVRKLAKRHLEADLIAVDVASPDRVEPRCPHFGTCGGCDLQHMAYEAQLRAKHEMVRGSLRSGGLDELAEMVVPVVAGPDYGYRQRIMLHVDRRGRVGYFVRRSYRVLAPATCPISLPAIDSWLQEGGVSLEGVLEGIEGDLVVEAAENGLFCILVVTETLPYPVVAAIIERLSARFVSGAVQAKGTILGRFGPEAMVRTVAGIERWAAPGVFSQVNPAINTVLIEAVMAVARETGAKSAYDFYAGSGNFALPLAASGVRVLAVESDPVLVSFGKSEAKRAGLTETTLFVESTLERFLRKSPASVDLVIADPPRSGLGELVERFDFSRHLVLISCELSSAVRDLKALTAAGWTAKSITPFDMFAQTANVELLTVLERA